MRRIANRLWVMTLRVNKPIALLTLNDIFTWGAYGIITMLTGLYLAFKLEENPAEVVGIGIGIALLMRGLIQIPIGILSDRISGTRDEIIILMIGNLMMGIPVILTTQISEVWHFYVLKMFFGIGAAFNIVNWRKLFASSLDHGKEGLEYAFYDMFMSVAAAVITILGGIFAAISMDVFSIVIASTGVLIIFSNLFLIPLLKQKPK